MKSKKKTPDKTAAFSPAKSTTAIIRDAVESFEKTEKQQSPSARSCIIAKLLNEMNDHLKKTIHKTGFLTPNSSIMIQKK